MRISVVTDIHGNYDGLKRIAEDADKLVVLGDLLDYVDYHNPSAGIMGEVFGADAVKTFTKLRSAGEFAALRTFNQGLWDTVADAAEVLSEIVQRRYRAVAAAIPSDSLVMLGNVDVAAEWSRAVGKAIPYRDAEVVEVDGIRLGFVSGGARRQAPAAPQRAGASGRHSPWQPFIRDAASYRAAVDALGPADILCSHVPPNIPGLRYDVIPARLEMYGPGLCDYIDRYQPRYALFGHVHQPLAKRYRHHRTECINIGHFQREETGYIIDTDHMTMTASGRR